MWSCRGCSVSLSLASSRRKAALVKLSSLWARVRGSLHRYVPRARPWCSLNVCGLKQWVSAAPPDPAVTAWRGPRGCRLTRRSLQGHRTGPSGVPLDVVLPQCTGCRSSAASEADPGRDGCGTPVPLPEHQPLTPCSGPRPAARRPPWVSLLPPHRILAQPRV